MRPYPLTMQQKMTRLHGHLFLAPGKLYFVCQKKGGAWAAAIGQGVGGLLGAAIAAAAGPKPGEAPTHIDEAQIAQACAQQEGSLVMDAANIQAIKVTWMWRLIKFDNKTYGLPNGMDKDLRVELGQWAAHHNVVNKGLK